MDEELLNAIKEQADLAEEAKPKMLARYALARELHGRFGGRSVEEIADKLADVWRARGLFFATVNGKT